MTGAPRLGVSLVARMTRILRLAAAPSWAAPAVVGLSLVGAALEGAGLYLFIPLVQSLGGSATRGGALSAGVEALLAPIAPGWRTAAIVGALCMTVLLKSLVGLLNGYLAQVVDGQVAHQLRRRIFAQTLSSAVDDRPTYRLTDLANTVANNTWSVSKALSLCYRVIVCVCTCLVFLALLLVISPPLTLLSLALLAVTALLVHRVTRRAEDVGQAVVDENKRFGLRMWESLGALKLIRSFGREAYELRRFDSHSEAIRGRILQLNMLWALPGPIAEVSAALVIGVLILAGVASGAGVAELAAFLAVLYRLQAPVRELMQSRVAIDSLTGSVDDVETFLKETAEPGLADGAALPPPLAHAITFRHVSFRYGPAEPLALDDVSFEIPAGKTTAIVGRSGAGKSTLFSLLFRFRDPEGGEVLADGAPLTGLRLAAWRGQLALMSQDAHCFNDTVEANIAYGDPNASPGDVRRAAEIAGADAFIAGLPDGYATMLGDRGVRLSGGQRQRIALARAILRRASILLLDEPTNALDNESEHAFQAALEDYAKDRTIVVIAHRLSTVQSADQVVVLDQGKVVEQGTPRELLARPGRFARLYGLEARPPLGQGAA